MSKETTEFSWTTLFCVTSLSFFLFSAVIRLLRNDDYKIFLVVGLAAGVMGFVNYFGHRLIAAGSKKQGKK